ncbi:ATP-binding protein [Jeongeupia chitinilytica]|uniref:histidine kinase n=1 Tax=Jeongeupia chitinilytica TaxID=1041641 RepID=A0ABQ3GV53_9NEIS|nr:ATP-binding protein [Jeongeupia chitinilytica]GHD56463.1 two-component sensor histidine kinase [Jeongeupia chitinilytica]
MLRLFIRVYLIQIIGFAIAITALEYGLDYITRPYQQDLNYEMARGSFGYLADELRGKPLAEQQAQVRKWQPDYGLGLRLVDGGRMTIDPDERALLDSGKFFGRDDFQLFFVPIDWPRNPTLLEIHVKPPPRALILSIQIGSYLLLALTFAFCLYLWFRPHWRDLQQLKAAAKRFGDGDLGARAGLPRRSSIRDLATQFDQMATQIESQVASRRDLTNAVSHELRTPMARLAFELDAARKLDDPAQWRVLIGNMRQDLNELETLTSELLSFARLEHASNAFIQEPVHAAEWLDSVVAMVAIEADVRGVRCAVATGTPETVTLDARQMARALINVVRNGVYHARSRVEVSLMQTGSRYTLWIDDDGNGIPEGERHRVFDPFVRLDESRNRATGGFGLGLAIVRQIVRSHQGEVHIEDSPLGGARFVLQW